MLKHICFSVVTFALMGCMSEQDILTYLQGSWEGDSGSEAWCVSYEADGEHGVVNLYIESLANNNLSEQDAIHKIDHQTGWLIVDRGGRFMHKIASTHSVDGLPIPELERRAIRSSYLINDYGDDSFKYNSSSSGKQYINRRVENCDKYSMSFKGYLSEIELHINTSS